MFPGTPPEGKCSGLGLKDNIERFVKK